MSSESIGDVRTIRSAFGGTVNDVVLAAVSGGYRDMLLSHGEDADRALVRSVVPVSMRHDDDLDRTDNRVSILLDDLPVRIETAPDVEVLASAASAGIEQLCARARHAHARRARCAETQPDGTRSDPTGR